jgi:hypothetical protein
MPTLGSDIAASTGSDAARQVVSAVDQSPHANRPAAVGGYATELRLRQHLTRRRTCHWNGRRLASLAAAAHRQRSPHSDRI